MNSSTSLDGAICDLFGNDCRIAAKHPISGGDINEAYCLTLNDGTSVFMKCNSPRALRNFQAEAAGLEAIRSTRAIGVPRVLALGKESGFSFLLLEYVAGSGRISRFWETFAEELSAMHRAKAEDYYGFRHDNWIGGREQKNDRHDSWIAFFRDCRLAPQFQTARPYFSAGGRKRIEWLLANLDRYLIEPARPSLVHGDLWAGNMITGNDGKGWLIDPAVYYGHPEVDLAMTQLFGGFSCQFYECYRETGNLETGYEDRKDLYNLYQLLNHLNMFGSGYLGSVNRILERYA